MSKWYERHRKTVNENLGLIVSLLTAIFARWAGYEARQAGMDASNEAEKQIVQQSRSVDAQVQAMQLDERPFISIFAEKLTDEPTSATREWP